MRLAAYSGTRPNRVRPPTAAEPARPNATQGELDAAATALATAVTAFRNAMHGASLIFAEETMDGDKHVLVLTYDYSLQAVTGPSAFTLSAGGLVVTGAQLAPGDSSQVRLFVSGVLPAAGNVTVTAAGSAVVLSGGANNTADSVVHVLPTGVADALRQALYGSAPGSGGRIDMSAIAQYLQQQFVASDKHGIAYRTLIQFCLQQIAPLFLGNSPGGI
ncbi:hypothetical protein B5M42_007005 [Paenibacillus athensensis]|uniref:Uncharacterized protein n=1 Tax=Paenibacillus athensensis TaxID=1967502 RepID=A0A4Y8PZH4_9BACL|nr:hypothetical protein [Paenibacillus athensensis]MCD1258581.1 hypothetical protein [Paenibacillus athensensis]